MYIASALTVAGAVWFYRSQRRPLPVAAAANAAPVGTAGPETGPGGDPGPEGESRESEQAAPGPS